MRTKVRQLNLRVLTQRTIFRGNSLDFLHQRHLFSLFFVVSFQNLPLYCRAQVSNSSRNSCTKVLLKDLVNWQPNQGSVCRH